MGKGWKPGKPKTGGRTKGTPNKLPHPLRQDLLETLRELGFDPVVELVRVSQAAWQEYERAAEIHDAIQAKRASFDMVPLAADEATKYLAIALGSAKDVMQYVYPKRKAVELTGEGGKDLFSSFNDWVRGIVNESEQGKSDGTNQAITVLPKES